MRISEFKIHFVNELKVIFPKEEIDSFFKILMEEHLDLSPVQMALNPKLYIEEDKVVLLKNAVEKLKQQQPIQYVIGHTEFCGLRFKVNSSTLIPRPETEELVEWIVEENKQIENLKILDIGTGSGCIAITLAKLLPGSKVTAVDISKAALEVASQNALLNNVDIDFVEMDILQPQQIPAHFDIIVSNPPYVRELEREFMQPNVLNYEPGTALFVPDGDALVFYRTIAKWAKEHLKEEGCLYFEINEYFSEDMRALLTEMYFSHIQLKCDIYGKYRMIKGIFK